MEFGVLKKIENAGLTFPLYVNTKPGEGEDGDKLEELSNGFFYVLAKNGVYLVCKNESYTQITPAKSFGGTNLLDIKEETTVLIPKIDRKTFDFIVDLFKAVYKKFSSEVNVLLYYSHSAKKWFVRLPKQEVSGASVNYELTDDDVWYQNGEILKKAPANVVCFGTCHSHASMGAFFSATDDGDDKSNTGYQIVIGKVNSTSVETKCRLSIRGQNVDKTLGEVVEDVEDLFPDITVPDIVSRGSTTGYSASQGYYDYEHGGYDYPQTERKTSKTTGFTVSAAEMDVTFVMQDNSECSVSCPLTSVSLGTKKKGKK